MTHDMTHADRAHAPGLAAYIAEKFWRWSDIVDARVESRHDRDWLLTNISLYWLTGTITSSMRLYKASHRA